MAADTRLILDVAYTLGAALFGAILATTLRQSVILGYVLAGVAVGPFTPGFVADRATMETLANIGIIFLLFTIGVHISPSDLLTMWRPVVIGGSAQVIATIGLGYLLGHLLGLKPTESLVLGFAISNSSSTVLGKVLSELRQEKSEAGQLAMAWSTLQDLSTILIMMALTAMAATTADPTEIALSAVKALLFLGLLVPLGAVLLPKIFSRLAALRSREIFVLAVACLALSAAYASQFLGLSLALGAFVAGVVVAESDLAHVVLDHIGPLRDLLAAFFFVSVGMLVDPSFLAQNPVAILLAAMMIVLFKGAIVALLALAFRYEFRTAGITGVYLAQCAEFSILIASAGTQTNIMSPSSFSLVLTASLVSIVMSPILSRLALTKTSGLGG